MERAERRNNRMYRRRGAAVVFTAAVATTLVAIAALGVDIGYIVVTRAKLQTAADAGALAATRGFPSPRSVVAKAQHYAVRNHAGHGAIVAAHEVTAGRWDKYTKSFSAAAAPFNAVRVTARRSRATGNSIGLFFARTIGVTDTELSAGPSRIAPSGLVWKMNPFRRS